MTFQQAGYGHTHYQLTDPLPHSETLPSDASQHRRELLRTNTRNRPQSCALDDAELFDHDGLIDFLRAKHPTNTAYWVESLTQVPAATFKNWLERRSRPTRDHFIRLIFAYGPSLLQACCPNVEWIDEAVVQWRLAEITEAHRELEREKCRLLRNGGDAPN